MTDPHLSADDRKGDRQPYSGQGVVKRYIEEKGFGFISREGASDLFFHAKQLECSRPYEGEAVSFVIGKDDSGRDVAEHIMRVGRSTETGDVIEWHVDPASWWSEGKIQPHTRSHVIMFSWSDVKRVPGVRPTRPRPWHAATYHVIETSGGERRAVDVEIDWRYPLHRFAFLDDEEGLTAKLKALALHEDWNYRTSASRRPNEILYNYLHFTFARLVDEDRELSSPIDKKIRIVDTVQGYGRLAAFNTGLVDKRYESIFALFEPNEPGRQQRWRFMTFCTPGEDAGKLLSRYFNPLPRPAQYFSNAAELLYDPDAPLHPDYRHILTENRERLPAELIKMVESLEPVKAENTLKMHVDRAIELARKRTRWNYKTAIPHYFPTFKRLDFLLPLSLLDDAAVDAALAVQKTETGYIGNTILPLDWAYKSARLVCRPDSDWLSPDQIDAGAGDELGGDV